MAKNLFTLFSKNNDEHSEILGTTRYTQVASSSILKLLPEREQANLKRIDLQPVQIANLKLDLLQMQYRHELPIDDFFINDEGIINRSIVNSPFYKLLVLYQARGKKYIKKNLETLDYYRMFKSFGEVGFRYDWYQGKTRIDFQWADEKIWGKVEHFIYLYENIKKLGYREGRFSRYFITILIVPFEVSRHGQYFNNWKPFEIWSGHHRAAVLTALGFQYAHIVLLSDKNPLIKNYDQLTLDIKKSHKNINYKT